jgi:hypothetical protein
MKITHIKVEGASDVVRNLNREIIGIRNRTRAGLHESLLVVEAATLPLTPVLTGNLRRSMRTAVFGEGDKGPIWGAAWFEAAYALWVHERKLRPWGITINVGPKASGRWGKTKKGRMKELGRLPGEHGHRPPTQWKFLETALKNKSGEILRIIQERAKIQ